METKKKKIIVIVLLSQIVLGCVIDPVTYMEIFNDTEYSVTIEDKKNKITILPNESELFGFSRGWILLDDGEERIASVIRRRWADGFTITYLENIYNLTPEAAATLVVNIATSNTNVMAYIHTLMLSELLSEIRLHSEEYRELPVW